MTHRWGCVLVALVGCSSNSGGGVSVDAHVAVDSGSGSDTVDAYVTAAWSFKSIDGTQLSCPTGFGKTALYSQRVDPVTYASIGQPIIDLFDCNRFQGTSDPLPPTTYYAWLQIESTDGASIYASTPEAFVDLTVQDKTFSASIYDDAGYFQVAWQLQAGGASTSCAANPDVTGVEAISTEVGNASNSASDIFHCADHYGITDALPVGDYTISLDAFNAAMQAVGTATPASASIQDHDHVTDLGTITIPLD